MARQTRRPGASIACEFLHAAAMLCGSTPTRVRRADPARRPSPGADVGDDDRRRADAHARALRADRARRRGDVATREEEAQTNRFFSVPEMRLLRRRRGCGVREIVPAYTHRPDRREYVPSDARRRPSVVRVALIITEIGRADRRQVHVPGDDLPRRLGAWAWRRTTSS